MTLSRSKEKHDTFLSLVIYYKDLPADIAGCLKSITGFLQDKIEDFEIVIVSNSHARYFHEQLRPILKNGVALRHIAITNTDSKELALASGLENSIGDISILYSPKNDPLEVIDLTVSKILNSSCDLVIGSSQIKKSLLYIIMSALFKKLLFIFLQYEKTDNATDFRGIPRATLNSVLSRKFHLSQLFFNLDKYTSDHYVLNYQVKNFAKRRFNDGFKEAHGLIVNNSVGPLRFISVVGVFGSSVSVLISVWVFVGKLTNDLIVDGWASLSIFVSVQMFLVFCILTIFGEYLARLVYERWDAKEYDVVFEEYSSALLDEERRNVLFEPEN